MHPEYTDSDGTEVRKPASIIDGSSGLRISGPTDEQLARNGVYRAAYAEPDHGRAVLGYVFKGIASGRSVFEPVTMDLEEFLAATHAAQVAGLVAQHGGTIAQLGALLARFGLSMPITTEQATAAVYAAAKAEQDPEQARQMTLDAVLLANLRSSLPMTESLLYDCAVAMAAKVDAADEAQPEG